MTELTFTTQSQLLHHGIEGQKWGVQNGPPYPLDRETAKEVKKQALKDVKEAAKQEHKEYYKNKPVYFNYIGGSTYAYFPKDKVTSIKRIEDSGTSYEYFNMHGLTSAQFMQQMQNEQAIRQAMNEPYLAGAVTGYSFAPF